MVTISLSIINKLGLHARAAVKLVETASRFKSEVILARGNKRVNGKSIMGVMMLAAAKGSSLNLIVNGSDEIEAAENIRRLVARRFGESE